MTEKRFPNNPLTLACQPWKEDFTLDKERFADELDSIKAYGRFTIYMGCTAGEGYALSNKMFQENVSFFADQLRGYTEPVMVSIITTSLAETIERVGFVKSLGIKNIMFPLPSWGVLRKEEAENYMHHLFSAHPDCNFIHYNHSPLARIRMYADSYDRLAKAHSNFVAVKNACCDHTDIRLMAEYDTPLLEYYLEFYYPIACQWGLKPSLLPSVLCTNRKVALEYYDAGQRGDWARTQEIDRETQKIVDAMGEFLEGGRNDGCYDKLFQKMNDPKFPIRMYPPYIGFTDEQYERFAAAVRERVPSWFE